MTGSSKPGRRWYSTQGTRQAVLDAARDVFFESGYAEASIGAIVERSSVSVGSIYHHFGGKAGLFEALWQTYTETCSFAARNATAAARALGVTDPVELFIAGSLGYLSALSDPGTAKLSRIFLPGDCPPGFDSRARRVQQAWVRSNAVALGFENTIEGRLRAAVATAIVGEGEVRYAREADEAALEVVIKEVTALLRCVLA